MKRRPQRIRQLIIGVTSLAVAISMVCSFMVYLQPRHPAATATPTETVAPSVTPTSTPTP